MINGIPLLFGEASAPSSAPNGDPYLGNVVLLMNMDGAEGGSVFTEYTGKIVTAGGGTTVTSVKKFGTASARVNNNNINLADSPDWDMGAADFTIEAWINIVAYNTYFPIINQWGGSNYAWALYLGNTGIPRVYVYIGAVEYGAVGTAAIPLSTWTHVAAVRIASTLYLYVNGVAVASAVIGAGSVATSSLAVSIGQLVGSYGNGYIDDLRITKGVGRYTANFEPPTTAFPSRYPYTTPEVISLLLHGDGANNSVIFTDTAGWPVAPFGNAKISTTQSKFGGSSIYLDGAGDYLKVNEKTAYEFLTGDFTIEAWIYPTALSGDKVIASRYTVWASAIGFYLAVRAGTPNILIFRAGNAAPINLNGNTAISLNQWVHVAVSRSSGVTKMFVGGVTQTATHTGSVSISSTSSLVIGAGSVVFDENFAGYIDDLRITKGAWQYIADFTPPVLPHPDF